MIATSVDAMTTDELQTLCAASGDGLHDYEQVVFARDPATGARAILLIHSTACGNAFGGIRRWRYRDLGAAFADVQALARAMTWKCAMAELPAGGGKCVILDEEGLDRRAAYELVGDLVAQLGGRFHTGPDVGTTVSDLQTVASRTKHCATEAHGDLSGSTASGVFAAIEASARAAGFALPGKRVLVQGVGAVGSKLCERLRAADVELMVADLDRAVAEAAVARFGAVAVAADRATSTPCDLFAPCAVGGLIDEVVARRLPTRAVCGAANNVLASSSAGAVLHARGIPVAPDFVANAGGLIHGVTVELSGRMPLPERFARIGDVVGDLLLQSRRDGVPPAELALTAAKARVAAARTRRA